VTSLRYQLTLQAQLLKASKLIDRQVEVMEDQARSLAQEQETGPPGLSVTKQNLNRGSTLPNNGWHALQHRFDNNWSLFLEKTLFFRISGNRYLPVFECSYFFSESDPYKICWFEFWVRSPKWLALVSATAGRFRGGGWRGGGDHGWEGRVGGGLRGGGVGWFLGRSGGGDRGGCRTDVQKYCQKRTFRGPDLEILSTGSWT
jgi:hypothetical protein